MGPIVGGELPEMPEPEASGDLGDVGAEGDCDQDSTHRARPPAPEHVGRSRPVLFGEEAGFSARSPSVVNGATAMSPVPTRRQMA